MMKWFASIVLVALVSFGSAKFVVVSSYPFREYLASIHHGLDVVIPGITVNGLCVAGIREETGKCDTAFGGNFNNYCDFIGCDQWDPNPNVLAPFINNTIPPGRNCDYSPSLEYSNMVDEVMLQSVPNEFVSTSTVIAQWCTRPAICEPGDPDNTMDCDVATWQNNGAVGVFPGNCVPGGPNPQNPVDRGFEGYCRTCTMRAPELLELNAWTLGITLRTYFFDESCDLGLPLTP
ncbi:MAG: hypothetical protein Q8M16_06235 [Pirellulaceae bacterium]|nr:hypothetical protein [Pirellulaceae bacterium]